jgi:hypothetical protein
MPTPPTAKNSLKSTGFDVLHFYENTSAGKFWHTGCASRPDKLARLAQ